MKILTILGSPRKRGNTARTLDLFDSELKALGHSSERINLSEHKVNGCKGCLVCKDVPDKPGCPQKDDAVDILNRIIAADAVVYATPLYCWCFSAQMKALIDRHCSVVTNYGTPDHKSLMAGKPTALLVTCEDEIEGNADLIQIVFDRINEYIEGVVVGKYIVPNCTEPKTLPPAASKTAEKMAKDITENRR